MTYSSREHFANAAIGLRGWRVRSDLHWGVPPEEFDDHVAEGWRLAEPFRVSVLTANDGYLVRPQFFLSNENGMQEKLLEEKTPLLDFITLNSSAARLVDDVWINGHLSKNNIPRYVVPLSSHASTLSGMLVLNRAVPSIDVTKAHALEGQIQRSGFSRTTANWVALNMFQDAWKQEDIFYITRKERKYLDCDAQRQAVPALLTRWIVRARKLLKLIHHLYIHILFGI